jgi:hypothetical protein
MSQSLLPYLTPSGFGSQTTATGSTTPRALPDRATDLGINVKDFGALGNTQQSSTNCTVALNSTAFSTSNSLFAASDVGKTIQIPGAGTSGGVLTTTIAGYTSPTAITLGHIANTALSAANTNLAWGADDSAAIAAAMNHAISIFSAGGYCYIYAPAGYYYIYSTQLPMFNACPIGVLGDGSTQTVFVIDPAYAYDVFSWGNCWQNTTYSNNPKSMNGQLTGGGFAIGLGFNGNLASTANINAIGLYNIMDFFFADDIQANCFPGSVICMGGVTGSNTVGCIRESEFRSIRCWLSGTSTKPVIDIDSQGLSDSTNELVFYNVNIFHSNGDSFVIRNQSISPVRLIKIFGLRIEAEASGYSALRLGDSTYTGAVYGVRIYGLELVALTSGVTALNFASPSSGGGVSHVSIDGQIVNSGTAANDIYVNTSGPIFINLDSALDSSGLSLTVTALLTYPLKISTTESTQNWTKTINASALTNVYFNDAWNNGLGVGFSANLHDGSALGGHSIGTGSVDLQTVRTAGYQSATGNFATLLAGSGSEATASNSLAGGTSCLAGGSNSISFGSSVNVNPGAGNCIWVGNSITGSGTPGNTVAVGSSLTMSGGYGLNIGAANTFSGGFGGVIGGNSTNSGNYSFSVGDLNTVSGNNCLAVGYQANVVSNNKWTQAAGSFVNAGDAQVSRILLKATTSNTSATRLTCDGSSTLSAQNLASIYYPAAGFAVKIILSATDHTTNGNTFTWQLPLGLLQSTSGSGSTTWAAGTPTSLSTGTGSGASVTVAADTTYGALALSFTAPNSDTWHVVALVEFVEVG